MPRRSGIFLILLPLAVATIIIFIILPLVCRSHNNHFHYFATGMRNLCVSIPSDFKAYRKAGMGSLTCVTILMCAGRGMRGRHRREWCKCRLGRTEKRSFTGSRPGLEPRPLDFQSRASAKQPRVPCSFLFNSNGPGIFLSLIHI